MVWSKSTGNRSTTTANIPLLGTRASLRTEQGRYWGLLAILLGTRSQGDVIGVMTDWVELAASSMATWNLY